MFDLNVGKDRQVLSPRPRAPVQAQFEPHPHSRVKRFQGSLGRSYNYYGNCKLVSRLNIVNMADYYQDNYVKKYPHHSGSTCRTTTGTIDAWTDLSICHYIPLRTPEMLRAAVSVLVLYYATFSKFHHRHLIEVSWSQSQTQSIICFVHDRQWLHFVFPICSCAYTCRLW